MPNDIRYKGVTQPALNRNSDAKYKNKILCSKMLMKDVELLKISLRIRYKNFASILKLQKITSAPNNNMEVLRGSFPASLAAIGAASKPPITNPTITCQWVTPINVKKVKALAKVTKNSVRLTDPITNR